MTFQGPSGLENVTQRIDEIRQRLAAFRGAPLAPAEAESPAASFDAILSNRLATPNPSAPVDKNSLETMIEREANAIGLDPSLAKAVAKAESGLNPQAVSGAGAVGLMQLMPDTARELGVRSLLDPVENAKGGTRYLKSLVDRYHSVPQALAAYNAGPGVVDRHHGIPPYSETRNYVNRVLDYQRAYAQNGLED